MAIKYEEARKATKKLIDSELEYSEAGITITWAGQFTRNSMRSAGLALDEQAKLVRAALKYITDEKGDRINSEAKEHLESEATAIENNL